MQYILAGRRTRAQAPTNFESQNSEAQIHDLQATIMELEEHVSKLTAQNWKDRRLAWKHCVWRLPSQEGGAYSDTSKARSASRVQIGPPNTW